VCGLICISSCSVPVVATQDLVLPNGTVVTIEEQKKLENLRPAYEKALTPVIGDSRMKSIKLGRSVDVADCGSQLEAAIKAFMEAELGPDYAKYIYRGEYSPQSVSTTCTVKGISKVLYGTSRYAYRGSWTGTYTDTSVGVNNQSYVLYAFTYADANWFTYPCGSYNVSATDSRYYPKSDHSGNAASNFIIVPSSQKRTYVQDAATGGHWGSWVSADNETAITFGSLLSGFFPAGPKNFVTQHEVVDNKCGDTVTTYSWN
jgi:hypothetical protein